MYFQTKVPVLTRCSEARDARAASRPRRCSPASAGTWSPCGFSMIETIGPVGHTGGRATTARRLRHVRARRARRRRAHLRRARARSATLLHGADERLAYVAGRRRSPSLAALAELRGVADRAPAPPPASRALAPGDADAGRRRRSTAVLLGLGFTTFVLTFGVFALAGIAFALGDPASGVADRARVRGRAGAARSSLVAPIADRDAGIRVTETMAGRPGDLPRLSVRRRAGAARGRGGARRRLARRRRAHRGEARPPTRRSAATTSPSSGPTDPGSSAAAAATSRCRAPIRRSATAASR